ncbi:thiamine diphosphokinase [Terribacillus saccharophilus]|uniref:Thiamine diphosphokinase n=1 Tax=Terribacillus saccharophilus TaxID=361277 RepID=A0A268AAA8_9BACI|nr:thiamine diphosphokinase [Terribacillus saccharophilus]PAD21058.1 thiamine diphosphokinase [Terribacillus saccharophilus]PAF17371.1 thiamine diphosphokinase [Terribacillus saccharophilus]PAF22140.1 thiamine diphosphokinase [Terribacillus saccharophilus]PAF38332.1 thiamine diphosphokinase [Terribacillus saccharophilus]PAF40197.1 thiamine diphosphokinase [Terribacillus saccharophilus]
MNTKLSIGLVGGAGRLPDLHSEHHHIWIGADAGALALASAGIRMKVAVGDFDSVSEEELITIRRYADQVLVYPPEKDETDFELAIRQAEEMGAADVAVYGVTGGRLDHELINIQMLYRLLDSFEQAVIIDWQNNIRLHRPGTYRIERDDTYRYISFLSFSEQVTGLTLTGFKYPLTDASIHWGETLSISNELVAQYGTYSFASGIVIMIKSKDV